MSQILTKLNNMEIKALTDDIVEWANKVFPDRQPASALLKLFEEVGELVRNPDSPGEYADICIMLFDLANMHNIDLADAIRTKMNINRDRVWTLTKNGTMQHSDVLPAAVCRKKQAYHRGAYDARNGNLRNPGNNVGGVIEEWYYRGYDMAAGEGDVE